jgi:hypothetical protein
MIRESKKEEELIMKWLASCNISLHDH